MQEDALLHRWVKGMGVTARDTDGNLVGHLPEKGHFTLVVMGRSKEQLAARWVSGRQFCQ